MTELSLLVLLLSFWTRECNMCPLPSVRTCVDT